MAEGVKVLNGNIREMSNWPLEIYSNKDINNVDIFL